MSSQVTLACNSVHTLQDYPLPLKKLRSNASMESRENLLMEIKRTSNNYQLQGADLRDRISKRKVAALNAHRFECHYCQHVFSNQSNLSRHEKDPSRKCLEKRAEQKREADLLKEIEEFLNKLAIQKSLLRASLADNYAGQFLAMIEKKAKKSSKQHAAPLRSRCGPAAALSFQIALGQSPLQSNLSKLHIFSLLTKIMTLTLGYQLA